MAIRAFIAIEIDSEIKNRLSEHIDKLKRTGADVKWVLPGNIHLTLKFLGHIEEDTLPGLNKIVSDAASSLKSFNISIGNISAFPSRKRPRIVYACVEDKENILLKLHENLNNGVEKLGIKKESKKYIGHITLGRIKTQKNIFKLTTALKSESECFFGHEKISYLSLMQSQLTPKGPIYTKLNNFLLN
ncbi:MAG: RNA 2',3'-cyclic phosphodiesterase [Candidatus Brocadiaceae bacterium]|nr:RNA 2',3'-cyclic phosphodiesterase [Candidatus Brocadiaceae bacterium]